MVYKYEINEDTVPRAKCNPEDEIVMSGVSGRYPNSRNTKEFENNLYNKVYMCDDDERRWKQEFSDIPKRSGKVYDLNKFDSTFFRISAKQSNALDPQMRVLLEHAYEVILDAGINPHSLRGTKTGVFIGACFTETECAVFLDPNVGDGEQFLTGVGRSMFANRLSYTFDLRGPSCLIDTACSSSIYALNAAFNSIRSGECDAAIVGATNATLHPYVSLNFARLGVLAKDGVSRPFDDAASGYVRSEAFGCIFLQKAKDAKRIYGTVVYTKTNCDGFKPESITYPSGDVQTNLFESFYRDIGIDPNSVAFVEAHSTGTIVGDPEECIAIDRVFCKNRKKPLPIGSTKSNMGHSESAAGICSLTKCIFALENNLIPPNINFSNYRRGIEGFEKNRLQVVTEPQELDGPLIALNSFGFGGANAHCLLRRGNKEKINGGRSLDKLPRLVNWAGRTEEACNAVFDDISSRHLDAEFIGLIHGTQKYSTMGNVFRSFGVFGDEENGNAKCLTRAVQHYSGVKPKLVYVFSGMGSQWCEMGAKLMEIPMFNKSIEKCHNILVPKGLNLIKILTSGDKSTYDNVVHSFVGIASIQIGICDILKELGVQPDLIVGHSVGELGCAYADGCLTAEEMMLCSYSRGLATIETDTISGAMAAVGLGYQEIKSLLPDSIDVACHNSLNSSTISGPKKDVEKFVDELKAKKIFAKEVPAANRAFHSRYISQMGPKLMAYLKQVITCPKTRSDKWLSSSVPKDKWDLPESQICSAEYQTNNLLSPVLFEETIAQLPANAVTIEIAPHGLLQAILKKALPNCTNIALTQRENPNNHIYFLTALGKLFQSGVDITIENLYPKVEFPVSRGTPRLSHLIKWNHTEDFYILNINSHAKSGEKRFTFSLENEDYAYIAGHGIDGKCLYPGIGYLQFVWEVFARMNNKTCADVDIEFEEVKFLRATNIKPQSIITFDVLVNIGTGYFEVAESSMAVVTGYVHEVIEDEMDHISVPADPNTFILPTKDFYKELRLRGYHYTGLFKNVLEARSDGLTGKVKWENNWVTFIDCILQLCMLQIDTRSLMVPTGIEKLTIRPQHHFKFQLKQTIDDQNELNYFEVRSNKNLGILQCGGIEIKGIQALPIPRKYMSGDPVLEIHKFVPCLPAPKMTVKNVARFCAQTILENINKNKVTCVEVLESDELSPFSVDIKEGFQNLPQTLADMMILSSKNITTEILVKNETLSQQNDGTLAIVTNYSSDVTLRNALAEKNFEYLVLRETNFDKETFTPPEHYNTICILPISTSDHTIILLQKVLDAKDIVVPTIVKVTSHDKQFEWLEPLKKFVKEGPVIIYSQGEKNSGILGLVNCIRREFPKQKVRYFLIDDVNAPPFDINAPFYRDQSNLGMVANVYRNGKWGIYRHLLNEHLSEELPTQNHVYANITRQGDLSTFKWIEGPLNGLASKKDLVKIQYAALNFRDVMLATGKIAFEIFCTDRLQKTCPLGIEFSGLAPNGDRVMGINLSGALSNYSAINDGVILFKCPDNWTLAQAATVPIVYSTVYTALLLRGGIQKGNSILIHSGTGGVGLAAIRVCLAYGLTVFTTVGSPEKREYLLNNFPELKPNHIGNSRNLSFERMIKIETAGQGVDFVLNSLSGDKLTASIRCLAAKGKFLEIGKFDLISNSKIGLREFLREITFHTILLDSMSEASRHELKTVTKLMEQDIIRGIIQPLPTTIYPATDLQSAFRYLGSGKHIGKVLIQIRENTNDAVTIPISVIPKFFCDPESSYIILGGLGGFGLELADWLIARGASQLVLSSRTGISKPYQQHRINIWKSYGVRITVATSNITTRNGCAEIIKEAHRLGPVAGIFNLAVQLHDDAFENLTAEHFNEVFGPKSYATEHFDQLTRALCPRLKHFVVFSSISTGRGNSHQTNYGMSNSIMERIMEQRHNDNLPGIAIQWGAIGDVGIVADLLQDNIKIEIGGTITQGIASCLEELDRVLFFKSPVTGSMIVAEKNVHGTSIKSLLMRVLGIRDLNTISMDAKLSELGMDSMSAVEIKQTLENEFDLVFSPQELRVLTIGSLLEFQDKIKSSSDENEIIQDVHSSFSKVTQLEDITHINDVILQLESQNLPNSNAAVIMIPGIECVSSTKWNSIASTIKYPVFSIQLWKVKTVDEIPTKITEITKPLVTKLGKNIKQVYIVGHSFGSIPSLHLADELEKLKIQTTVLLIDGAPELSKTFLTSLGETSLQMAVLSWSYLWLFGEGKADEINKTFLACSSFSERLNKLLELAELQNKYPIDLIKQFNENFYSRLSSLNNYKLESVPMVKSKISLARVNNKFNLDEAYGLKSYSNDGTVDVKFFDGTHYAMLDRADVIEWILKQLE